MRLSAGPRSLPQLQKDEIELVTRAQGLADEIAQLSSELDTLVVDEAAVSLTDRVERLADLRARHVTAEKDIPERRLQLREAELVISGILSRIERKGEPDPARLDTPSLRRRRPAGLDRDAIGRRGCPTIGGRRVVGGPATAR